MRKIKKTDNKDRIICVTVVGKHRFYYQPVGSKERIWLFDTKHFSGSVFGFFRKHGRNLDGIGFSLTLRELHNLSNSHHNVKIAKILDRIPAQVEYVIREREDLIQMPFINIHNDYHCSADFDRAA